MGSLMPEMTCCALPKNVPIHEILQNTQQRIETSYNRLMNEAKEGFIQSKEESTTELDFATASIFES
jgi:hypothetical protein